MAAEFPSRVPEGEFVRPDNHSVARMLFTPDGEHLVAGGDNRTTKSGVINFWNVKTREHEQTLTQTACVSVAAFTPDGKWLVTGGWNNQMQMFEGPKWKLAHTFNYDPPTRTPLTLAMFLDSKRAVTTSGYSARIWDLAKRTCVPFMIERELISGLASSNDGKKLAIAYLGAFADIWDMEKIELLGRIQLAKTPEMQGVFLTVVFSPDGKWIATGSIGSDTATSDYFVCIRDAKTLKIHKQMSGLSDEPNLLTFTPDSKLLISGVGQEMNFPGKVHVWEVANGELVDAFSPWKHGCSHHALSPDGRWLVTCGVDGTLRLWDFQKMRRAIGK